jgi:hypothetical protein
MQNNSGGAVVPFVCGCHPTGPMVVVVVKRVFLLIAGETMTPIEPPPATAGCDYRAMIHSANVADSELAIQSTRCGWLVLPCGAVRCRR